METLPFWFWILYYLFILSTLVMSIIHLFRKRNVLFSTVALLLSIIIPVSSLFFSIGRPEGNEFGFMFQQAFAGSLWALFLLAGHLIMIIWWIKKIFTR
jgi:hypothetical protein